MKSKNYILLVLTGILTILIGVASIVYYIDPYFHYHMPNDKLQYNMETNNFMYYNAGLAKNFEYDTIITGSSMSRPFLPSYIDEKFACNSIKLSMAEARGKDFSYLLPIVCKKDSVNRIIIGIDTFAFNVDKDYSSYEKPEYLYDENILNDVYYLMNMDGLIECAKTIRYTLYGGTTTNRDEYQNYALNGEFGEEKVLEPFRKNYPVKEEVNTDYEELKMIVSENLQQNIIPYIENHKDIEFLFYFPPYSIVKWLLMKDKEYEIKTMEYVIETLVEYENVKLFFYQGEKECIMDLNHYMDTMHYDSAVANDIVDFMTDKKNALTKDTYLEVLNDFREFINTYDVQTLM